MIERLFKQLAGDCVYTVSDDEIGIYMNALMDYGLENIRDACLVFIEERLRNNGTPTIFPSVSEFERVILRLNPDLKKSVPPSLEVPT